LLFQHIKEPSMQTDNNSTPIDAADPCSPRCTAKARAKSAGIPGDSARYVDHERDQRDFVVITAIRTALEIVRHDDNDAADILQLALWKMESSWPVTDEKFTAQVEHVSIRALADRARQIVEVDHG
jgi:hypothetical protein